MHINALTLLFLSAAVVKVNVLVGDLQSTGINVHHSDQLTVLHQHQLLLLTRVLIVGPESGTERAVIRNKRAGVDVRELNQKPNPNLYQHTVRWIDEGIE